MRVVHVTCSSCGSSFALRSGGGDLTVERCAACHPAFTGRSAPAIGGDRIERFERIRARAARTPS
jgi:large subunit ribosomal protein L31